MSSNSIYPHVPYFYIIQHIPSGKYYAGAKWIDGCNPEHFMTTYGYQTSSLAVKTLIEKDGLVSFKKILVLTEDQCGIDVYSYESTFLQSNNIAADKDWLNGHNNDGVCLDFGSPEFKERMLKKYGVSHALHNIDSKIKLMNTCLEKYGGHPMTNAGIKESLKNKNLEKWGVENSFQVEAVKNKSKNTHIKKYGVDHISKTDKQRTNIKKINTGSKRWNDGITEYKVYEGQEPEPNWVLGGLPRRKFTQEEKEAKRLAVKGSKWYNDGLKSYQVRVDKNPEPHWVLGRV